MLITRDLESLRVFGDTAAVAVICSLIFERAGAAAAGG
jgi:hypothetical protein